MVMGNENFYVIVLYIINLFFYFWILGINLVYCGYYIVFVLFCCYVLGCNVLIWKNYFCLYILFDIVFGGIFLLLLFVNSLCNGI